MGMNSNQRRLARAIIGGAIFAFGALYRTDRPAVPLIVFLAALALAGGDVLWKAARNIARGRVFDENFLMSIATVGAFAIGDYAEGAAVMLFYQVGEVFQHYAVDRSRRSIAQLMDIRPDYANVRRDGAVERVDPDEVAVGEVIVIRPGEKVPLDAVVIEGQSSLDTSALTGESMPRDVGPGDELLSGAVNAGGLLAARTTRPFGESTVSRILELVENAGGKKATSERFITRFARYYTPGVVIVAALLALAPPLLWGAPLRDWVYRALVFLVVSCPCALVISVPLSFFGGIGGASRNGILVKGGNHLEALARAETVVFDKTGTLTEGAFEVREVVPRGIAREALLNLAARAERHSNHPIAQSLRRAHGGPIDDIADVREIPGRGVIAQIDGAAVAVGNDRLMAQVGAQAEPGGVGTAVYVAIDGVYRGRITVADRLKPDAARAVDALRSAGVRKVAMLTGDARPIADAVAGQLGLDEVYAELLPADKVEMVEKLLAETSGNGRLAFVGDGINDAPALARADVGIAMGGLGSDAAIEAADVVIMTDEPSRVAAAVSIARRTMAIVRQNIGLALGVKAAVMALGAVGAASMWAAVFADVGVAVLAILNAIRALRIQRMP